MIGAEQFARMREGSVYLNTARAALHDTDALVDVAAPTDPLGGAGLDHFVGERLRPTTRCARWTTSCSRRTSAARPTTPRPTTRR